MLCHAGLSPSVCVSSTTAEKKMTRTYQTLQSLLCPCCFEVIGAVPEVIDVNSASRRLPLFSAHRIVFLAFEGLS
jgi:hypothetical protein